MIPRRATTIAVVLISTIILLTGMFYFLGGCSGGDDKGDRDRAIHTGLGSEHTIYLPTLFTRVRRDNAGLYFSDDGIFGKLERINAIRPVFIRTISGDWQRPNDTLYQDFLSGGWEQVDLSLGPDLRAIRSANAIPIIGFMYGGQCKKPAQDKLDLYARFIADAIHRYNLPLVEVWNEPDFEAGLPSLYGCFGDQYSVDLIRLIQSVRSHLDSQYQSAVGVSYGINSARNWQMVEQVAPYQSWTGIHYYGVWNGEEITTPFYPGSPEQLYEQTVQLVPHQKVIFTEYNAFDQSVACVPEFYPLQMEFNRRGLTIGADGIIIFLYSKPKDWRCTGILGTLTDDLLMGKIP
jgi:hypothetical protein